MLRDRSASTGLRHARGGGRSRADADAGGRGGLVEAAGAAAAAGGEPRKANPPRRIHLVGQPVPVWLHRQPRMPTPPVPIIYAPAQA